MKTRRKVSKNVIREAVEGYLFVLPLLIGLIGLTLWPVIRSFMISFSEYNIVSPPKFVGFKNYTELFQDPLFWQSLKVTTIYSVISVPLGVVAGLAIALLMNQKV